MSGHGPDAQTFEAASEAKLEPKLLADTLAFMFESRHLIRPTRFALETEALQRDYWHCWSGLEKHFE
jgi:homogentisate 1,2-dioxygenase